MLSPDILIISLKINQFFSSAQFHRFFSHAMMMTTDRMSNIKLWNCLSFYFYNNGHSYSLLLEIYGLWMDFYAILVQYCIICNRFGCTMQDRNHYTRFEDEDCTFEFCL